LNVADLSTLEPIMTARFEMCQAAGYDAVEPDNMDGYENSTGFPITAAQQASYNEWIAGEVHSLGMAVFQKNDPDQASTLEPYFDGVIDEQCNEYSECSAYTPYLSAGKPVLNAEYSGGTSFCAADNAAGIMGALYSINLDGSTYTPCFGPSTTTPITGPVAAPPAPGSPTPPSGAGSASAPPTGATTPPAGSGQSGTSAKSGTSANSGKSSKPGKSGKSRKRPRHKTRATKRRGRDASHRRHHRRAARRHHRRKRGHHRHRRHYVAVAA
jgi:hypothetical protein